MDEGLAQPPREPGARTALVAAATFPQVPTSERLSKQRAGRDDTGAGWDAAAPHQGWHFGRGGGPQAVDAAAPRHRRRVHDPRTLVAERPDGEVGGWHDARSYRAGGDLRAGPGRRWIGQTVGGGFGARHEAAGGIVLGLAGRGARGYRRRGDVERAVWCVYGVLPVVAVRAGRTRRTRHPGPHPRCPAGAGARSTPRLGRPALRRAGPLPDAGRRSVLDLRTPPSNVPGL